MLLKEIILLIIGVPVSFFMVCCLGAAKVRDSISDEKKDQKYVFYIKITLLDSCFREFVVYSDYPYHSLTEMQRMVNRKEEKEFVEFRYQKEQVVLNRNKIISATMRMSLTGMVEEKSTKSLADRIRTIKKWIKERQFSR